MDKTVGLKCLVLVGLSWHCYICYSVMMMDWSNIKETRQCHKTLNWNPLGKAQKRTPKKTWRRRWIVGATPATCYWDEPNISWDGGKTLLKASAAGDAEGLKKLHNNFYLQKVLSSHDNFLKTWKLSWWITSGCCCFLFNNTHVQERTILYKI